MKHFNYLKHIILNNINKLLNAVQALYPTLFTQEIRDELFKYIESNMKLYHMSEKRRTKLKQKCMKKLFRRTIRNSNIPIHIRKPAEMSKRCNARIWANGKIVVLEDNKIQYGEQCYRPRYSVESIYCFQHLIKNTHGDFDKKPSIDIIYDYCKYNKTLKAMKPLKHMNPIKCVK
jgi:hypothetical protein